MGVVFRGAQGQQTRSQGGGEVLMASNADGGTSRRQPPLEQAVCAVCRVKMSIHSTLLAQARRHENGGRLVHPEGCP